MYDDRLVIPGGMRLQILDCIHTGHLGITKCRSRARTSVWWPGLSKQIEDLVAQCVTCANDRPTPKESLMSASFPSRPWERIATDLFELNGKVYLIVTDYYSRWFEFRERPNETSQVVIQALKEFFAIHGIPDLIISDNGPSTTQIPFVSSPPNMALYTPQVHQDTRKRMAKLSEQFVQLIPYSEKMMISTVPC